MAAAITTVVPTPTIVIGIANDTTTVMTTDIMAAITHQVAIGPGTVASGAGLFKTASASHIEAFEIRLEIEAADWRPLSFCPLMI
jgi:class 3 adenylate cyclase